MTLPLTLVGEMGFAVVPAMLFIVWSLFGIQELGLTIEQPFEKQLRMDVLIASIVADVREALLQADSFPSASAGISDEPQSAASAAAAAFAELRLSTPAEEEGLGAANGLQQPTSIPNTVT